MASRQAGNNNIYGNFVIFTGHFTDLAFNKAFCYFIGKIDTTYKKKVLDVMTEQKQLKNIKAYQTQVPFEEYVINDKVECYLIGPCTTIHPINPLPVGVS